MEPWGCFVAEEDNAKIVGTALAVAWGSVGLLGPVAVLTNYQNQTIGQQLIRATQEFFDENKTALQGVMSIRRAPSTWPSSQVRLPAEGADGADEPRPRPQRAAAGHQARTRAAQRAPLLPARRDERRRRRSGACTASPTRSTAGLDLLQGVEIVDGLALGDTLRWSALADLVGFAVVHTPGVSEAPAAPCT